MKKLLLVLLIVLAATPVFSQVTHWGGVRFDTPDNKAMLTYGQVLHLGGRAYMIPQFGATIDLAKEGFTTVFSLEPDVAFLWSFGNGWTAGPIVGPNFDWQQNPDGGIVTYLPFAIGAVINKKNLFTGDLWGIDLSTVGVWAAFKNQIDVSEELLDTPTSFYQGTAIGVGLSVTL